MHRLQIRQIESALGSLRHRYDVIHFPVSSVMPADNATIAIRLEHQPLQLTPTESLPPRSDFYLPCRLTSLRLVPAEFQQLQVLIEVTRLI